jgi:uncharacterized protein (TIGR03437 family)
MKQFWGVACLVAAMASVVAAAQPAIRTDNGVLNASSYTADIARGSWFVIFGSGMGPASISVYSGALPYPATLSGTSVSFTPAAGGSAIAARLWYTLAGQLAGMLPSTAAAGDYDVKVTYNGSTSAASRVKVVERNFGYATQTQNGAGPAQATYGGYDLNRFTTGKLAQWSLRPAKVGDTMVLWGTGLGADANSDLDGRSSLDQKDLGAVMVVVGGIRFKPDYAGRSFGSPGLDQINFKVPNVTPSCFVSLSVEAGGKTSNIGSIAVTDAGKSACVDPTFTEAQLSRLDQGGTLSFGSLNLTKTIEKASVPGVLVDNTSEVFNGAFYKYGVDGVGPIGGYSITQIGACYIYRLPAGTGTSSPGGTPVYLDAGPQLTLNGPNASNKVILRADGRYDLMLYNSGYAGQGGSGTPTLAQGTYTLAGPGGADVKAFSVSLDVPGSFLWTNEASLANPIPRSTGMPITWTNGGSGLVTITGVAMVPAGGPGLFDMSMFICTSPATAGNFTVPSSVLQQLPAVSSDSTSGSVGTLAVSADSDASKQGIFSAPLTAGGTLDQGLFSYSIGTTKSTGWQ